MKIGFLVSVFSRVLSWIQCFLPELHEVRGLGNQILQRGRKGTGSPSLPPKSSPRRGVASDRAKGSKVKFNFITLQRVRTFLFMVFDRPWNP
jgi:hypothetical protein